MDFCILKTPKAENYSNSGQILTDCNSLCIRNDTDATAYVNGMILKTNEIWCIDELPGCMFKDPLSLQFATDPTSGTIYVQRYIRTPNVTTV